MFKQYRGTSVLIVEDSLTQANQLRYLLEKNGFTAAISANGQEALDYLQNHLPDLIISDIVMPFVNGYELCTAVRNNPKTEHLPVVLLTALSSPKDILQALECRADHFITKPYNEDYLLSRMTSILEMIRQRSDIPFREQTESDIYFQGQWFHISTNRQRILDLLMSTYESMVIRNQELIQTQNELRESNLQLELSVDEAMQSKEQAHRMLEELYLRDKTISQTNKELQLIHEVESVINQTNEQNELLELVCEKLITAKLFGVTGHVQFELRDGLHTQLDDHLLIEDQLLQIPLLAKNKIIGNLICEVDRDFDFTEQQIELLTSLGRQLGMALENIRLYEEARALSLHDSLTGLANRRYLDLSYSNLKAYYDRNQTPFAVILVDVDHFKRFNDDHGHLEGDQVLIQVADILKQYTRSTDLAVRFGGEEFLILLADSDSTAASITGERIREEIQSQLRVTVSMGVASFSGENNLASFIQRADTALYKAKTEGRNQVKVI